jgi:hypothetical protein
MGNQLCYALELFRGEFEFHMGCIFLEFVKKVLWRSAYNIVDLINLV